jgi:hypothetical protein
VLLLLTQPPPSCRRSRPRRHWTSQHWHNNVHLQVLDTQLHVLPVQPGLLLRARHAGASGRTSPSARAVTLSAYQSGVRIVCRRPTSVGEWRPLLTAITPRCIRQRGGRDTAGMDPYRRRARGTVAGVDVTLIIIVVSTRVKIDRGALYGR